MKKVYLFFTFFLILSFYVVAQQQRLDSIISSIKTKKDSVSFDKATSEIHKLWLKEQYDLVLSYENKLSRLAKNIEYNKGIGSLYLLIGNTYNATHQNNKAFEYYDKAIIYFKEINLERGIAVINNNKSSIEQGRGNLKNAIKYILKANLYFEKIRDTTILSSTYHNLGTIYEKIEKQKLAEEYYLKSISLKRKKNPKMLPSSLNGLSSMYVDQNKLDKAKLLLLESLAIAKKEQKHHYITIALNELGSIQLKRKKYKQARKYYDSSLTAAIKSQNAKFVALAKQKLGIVELVSNNYSSAEKWLLDARNDLEKLETTPLLLFNYQHLASLDSARGNFKQAFYWQKKYSEISDSNNEKENTINITQAEERYKADIQEQKRIDQQEKREMLAREKFFRYRMFTVISLLTSITFLVFLVYVFKSRKERRKYIYQLRDSNQVKNKLFSIISHDLKNEIHGLDSSLKLLKDNSISSDEFQEIVPLLANRTHQTSILLNNLLNWSKSQMKELRANPIAFNINDVINEKFIFFEPKANQKNIELINKLETSIVFADKDMFAIVSQNLLANAIKFCNTGNSISVTSNKKEDYFEICFQDTGVGIAPENLHKLFAEETFTTHGTQQESGTGLGLKICKELIELNNGSIRVESIVGQGTIFTITLPTQS